MKLLISEDRSWLQHVCRFSWTSCPQSRAQTFMTCRPSSCRLYYIKSKPQQTSSRSQTSPAERWRALRLISWASGREVVGHGDLRFSVFVQRAAGGRRPSCLWGPSWGSRRREERRRQHNALLTSNASRPLTSVIEPGTAVSDGKLREKKRLDQNHSPQLRKLQTFTAKLLQSVTVCIDCWTTTTTRSRDSKTCWTSVLLSALELGSDPLYQIC